MTGRQDLSLWEKLFKNGKKIQKGACLKRIDKQGNINLSSLIQTCKHSCIYFQK
jgi:hypothetical protein